MSRIHDDELRDTAHERPDATEERQSRARRRNFERPAVDIYSTETEMVVLADMPGVQKPELDITLEGDELVIEGSIHERRRRESALPWGFYRRFKLRTPFDRERIRARLQDGILKISLPKPGGTQARKVSVE